MMQIMAGIVVIVDVEYIPRKVHRAYVGPAWCPLPPRGYREWILSTGVGITAIQFNSTQCKFKMPSISTERMVIASMLKITHYVVHSNRHTTEHETEYMKVDFAHTYHHHHHHHRRRRRRPRRHHHHHHHHHHYHHHHHHRHHHHRYRHHRHHPQYFRHFHYMFVIK